jgi:ribose transport system ATP-binding protein
MDAKVVLSLKDITKRYPGVLALSHVSFDFLEGEVHA